MGYPAAYRSASIKYQPGAGFQKAPAEIIRFPLNRMVDAITNPGAGGKGGSIARLGSSSGFRPGYSPSMGEYLAGRFPRPRGLMFNPRKYVPFGLRALGPLAGELGATEMSYAGLRAMPGRFAKRLGPWVTAAWLLWEFYNWWKSGQKTQNGWIQTCSIGAPLYGPTGGTHTCGATIIHDPPGPLGNCGHPWNGTSSFHYFDSLAPTHPPTVNSREYRVATTYQIGTGPDPRTLPRPITLVPEGGYNPSPRDFHEANHRDIGWSPMPRHLPRRRPRFYEWPKNRPLRPHPLIDPHSLPINRPFPLVGPIPYHIIPYRGPNPFRSPNEQPDLGPHPRQEGQHQHRDKPKKKTKPQPRARGKGRRIDGGDPDWTSTEHGSIKGRARPHRYKKPEKKTKELKKRLNAFRGNVVYRILNKATEWQDWVDALYKTLPKAFRLKGNPHADAKAMQIYRHINEIKIEDAVKALVKNEIQDFLFGLLGQVSKRTAQKIGGPVDAHGRAMRKGNTLTRDAVNDVVDSIMKEVFK